MIGFKRILSLAAVVLAVGCGSNELPTERSSEPVASPSFLIGIGASGETIATDRLDYSPGDTVRITGTGWQPGELVQLTLTENPESHGPRVWNVTADSAGNISDSSFSPEEHHFGTSFTLTALGLSSGLTAQTTFTDGTFYWRGCTDSDWGKTSNWATTAGTSCPSSTPGLPTTADPVIIQNVAIDPIISAPANANSLLIEPGGHLTVSANLVLAADVTVTGTWTQTAGTVSFNSSGKKITIGPGSVGTYNQSGGTFGVLGANAPDFLIEANGSGTQSGGTLNVNIFTILTGRTFSQSGAGSLLALRKDWKVEGTGTFSSTGGKVQFATGAVWNSPSTATNQFFDLELDVVITPNAQTIGVAGNWINDAVGNPNNSNNYTVVFNGSGAQSIGGSNSTTFRNLTVNKGGGDLTLNLHQAVSNTLTFTLGNIVTNSNLLLIQSTGSVTRTSGHVIGNLQRHIPNGNPGAIVYDLGTALAYTPLRIDVDGSGGTAGGLIGAAFGVAHPNIGTSGLNPFVSRYWRLTATGTTALGATRTYKLRLQFPSGEAGNPNTSSEVRRWDGAWHSPIAVLPSLLPVYTRDLTSTEVNGFNAFSDFVVGTVAPVDNTPPDVTINKALGQADPTGTSPINFTVVFSEPVTGFADADVTLSGTAGATTRIVTGSGDTYNVEVSGMTGSGTVIASIGAGVAKDAANNNNTASTSTDNNVTYDVTAPTVTINKALGQADPTGTSPINFTVVFSEPVTGFADADVTLSGTAGATTRIVTGSGDTYNVEVSGMTGDGTVIASIGAAVATDAAGNNNAASTSTDNSVTYDVTSPSVTIDEAGGQADPTNDSPINFTVVFNEDVTGFTGSDVSFTGSTVGGTLVATVTGGPSTYNVAVTGMTGTGTVVASIPAGSANDPVGNPNASSTSTDNSVTYDATPPTVTINQAAGQADPAGGAAPINFTVIFSETVTGFTGTDVDLSSSTVGGSLSATVTGGPSTYDVAVTGMTGTGNVVASIPAGGATDLVGNGNAASTSTDNTVTYDGTPPTVTINQAAGQADPTNASPINFTVVFNEAVNGFTGADVSFTGSTVGGTLVATASGGPSTYTVAVTGMTGTGTVVASIPAGSATDPVGNGNTASTSTDNSVTYDGTPPTVTINQAAGQADPTNASPINFTVVFSESVTGFATGDVTLSGTAGATSGAVTGSGTTYNVAVSGMTGSGTVIASIAAGVATDGLNNNTASTSTDNTVTYDVTSPTVTINQAAGQADPTGSSPVNFTVVFSESVTGFATGDVTLSGTAGATTGTVTGTGTTYNVAVSGMSGDGTVIASVGAAVAADGAGNNNAASTSTDNTVTYENDGPITSLVVANPVPLNTAGNLTANVSDVTTGGSNIVSAEYNIDGGAFSPMTATDGSFNSPNENVRATLPGSATTGVFEVCVRGTDAAGNTGNTECALYAVYDPNGGFVTGGGWFNSPINACRLASCAADGSTVGKANFGFVSKYQKGATVPVGNTEFQFKAGDLNFHSSAYQWLVIAGARAQYKGTGTINGAGNYGFLITAIDGQINGGGGADKFRIKIWDKNNGDYVVYDNQIGADEVSSAATILGGGSILIHAK